ncbi:hypothetical protein KUW14_02070 [Pseudooceanicola nitratireducens]|uniref:hypothetical protein n=1 Tax=Pseudooceanicola nitratireducens TaxID=517719 RepID=UPI001C949C88|nr:hypothetical protein [Pseudooceanicola nitratireducens]MBY6164621.1 hypothetical protein [Pseudooceanicola nitratireducens]
MFPKPTTFPTENTHRLVVFLDQKLHGDYERMEDILADAARHLRRAEEAIAQLPYDAFKPIQGWVRDLGKHAEKCRFLTDDFRHAAQSALRELAKLDPDDAPALIGSAMRHLRDALEASHRVTDLLAAEQEISRHRGHHS